MFVWVHQQLYSLPSYKAIRKQRWNRRSLVGIRRGLQAVETSERLVDKGQCLGFGFEEEGVIVAADFAVERCQPLRREICRTIVVK